MMMGQSIPGAMMGALQTTAPQMPCALVVERAQWSLACTGGMPGMPNAMLGMMGAGESLLKQASLLLVQGVCTPR